jgi:hypothetical protein
MPAGRTAVAQRPRRTNEPRSTLPAEPAASSRPDADGRTRPHQIRSSRQGLQSPAAGLQSVPAFTGTAAAAAASFRGPPLSQPASPKRSPQSRRCSVAPTTLPPSDAPKGRPGDTAGDAATKPGSVSIDARGHLRQRHRPRLREGLSGARIRPKPKLNL